MKVLAVAIVVPLRIDTTGYTRVVIVEYAQRRLAFLERNGGVRDFVEHPRIIRCSARRGHCQKTTRLYNPDMVPFKVLSSSPWLRIWHAVQNFLLQSCLRQTVVWLVVASIGAVGLILGTWAAQWPTLLGTMVLTLVPAFGVDLFFSWRYRRWVLPLNEPMISACRRVEWALEAKGLCDPARWRVSALYVLGHALEKGMKQEDSGLTRTQCPTLTMEPPPYELVNGYQHLKLLQNKAWEEVASYWGWAEEDWDAWLYAAYTVCVREDGHRNVPGRVLKRLNVDRRMNPASLGMDLLRNPLLSVGFLFYPSGLGSLNGRLPPTARDALDGIWSDYPMFQPVRSMAETLNPEGSVFVEHRWMHLGLRTYDFLKNGTTEVMTMPYLDTIEMACSV